MKTQTRRPFIFRVFARPGLGVLFFLFFGAAVAHGQVRPMPEYQVKAAFLYNFTRFIDWPAQAFSSSGSPFVIGIAGTNPFNSYLNEIVAGEKVGNHPIVIRYVTSISEVSHCQMIFISSGESEWVKEVITAAGKQNILTVGESDYFSSLGGIINFFKEGDKVRVQINVGSARASQLNISSKLLGISRIFNPRGR